jgi:hypothetical protein
MKYLAIFAIALFSSVCFAGPSYLICNDTELVSQEEFKKIGSLNSSNKQKVRNFVVTTENSTNLIQQLGTYNLNLNIKLTNLGADDYSSLVITDSEGGLIFYYSELREQVSDYVRFNVKVDDKMILLLDCKTRI